ncbi:PIG-L family deacetylase [Gordonia otitidis]|uniref:N-acetyl-1-D-myo-Inosityl-2-amino-2-deoxy-alpha-D-glucopyranoside deacetylase MshB n=1 Tax=Gordonia otitidis (strain DSM 44809 / CCUG 52243 / JCM 12355 / NBRC 100426 / IFM 10032) TaxID=1108044 RepID=H5TKV9_GORO1|nr:PIG-L family deacetylase [Gordonia otitidis]UEA58905.1 PIG-L family deacetylase [Gordonia otitidis]GAB34117.1 N-acetyl-1-D-myo-Inosityl-2-amino-2-deoxy-alpha-D-glucopyranoside deacetylase MshB [Gordonia otitidis NBRC 100426]
MSTPRIMLVHAHPDDESLWTGGLIARQIALGGDISVVMCTWASGTPRHRELLDALAELGVHDEPILLGYADLKVPESAPGRQRLTAASFDQEVAELSGHIRRLRPDVLVTYDAYGIYGHPDHIRAHRLACAAADAAATPTLYRESAPAWQVRSLYFATISDWMVAELADELFPRLQPGDFPGTPAHTLGLQLDVSQWITRKVHAIESHKTELARPSTVASLMNLPRTQRDLALGTECFLRRDLVPGGCDI